MKESEQKQGRSKAVAKEITARTMNKERVRKGESKTASKDRRKIVGRGKQESNKNGVRALGFDEVYVQQVGHDMDGLFATYGQTVLPFLRQEQA